VLAIEETGDPDETYRTTGKAILFSAITIMGAFLIYTQMSNLAVRRTMIGAALAIPVIFSVTMLVVPLMYPSKKAKRVWVKDANAALNKTAEAPAQRHG
jgi:uncharacterized membrane protein YdfJ with MMPL/SSD domain